MNHLPALVVLISYVVKFSAHPGTWDGKVIMNENGAPLPDLSGYWKDNSNAEMVLQPFQPSQAAAVPPNSTYSVRRSLQGRLLGICTIQPKYDYETRRQTEVVMSCRSAHPEWTAPPRVAINVSSEAVIEILFSSLVEWKRSSSGGIQEGLGRFSTVKKVHVVFMNHYDVGYTDFVNGVDNTYMHDYFPLAEDTAQKMRMKYSSPWVYTTHPWLMERYLNCPCSEIPCLATSLNNDFEKPLRCPSKDEIANFTAAAIRGDIVWNGVPFNIQPENMAPELFSAGFDLVRRMDIRFGRPKTLTMSIRDVMYVTKAVLPHLKKHGILGLTIGSNGADYPPQVPKLHRWVDEHTQTDIMVAYHPYGYGGYSLKDCAEAPNGVALCTEFRTDNTGPPNSTDEVEKTLDAVRKEYPGAKVISSTFDAFTLDVLPVKDQLPVVDLEVGDTWTYGNPSDPLKIAQYRAIQRTWIACLKSGEPRCAIADPSIRNMTFFLLKAPEHTWGTPGISGWGGGNDYNVTKFRKNISHNSYMRAAASWAEQRVFNELAVRALEESAHPLAAPMREQLAKIENVVAPDLSGLVAVPIESHITLQKSGFKLAFREDGAIIMLESGGVSWASSSSPLAAFVYQTFNDSEWKPFTYSYMNDHSMQTGFCKPGSNNYTESALWRPRLKQLFVSSASSTGVDFVVAVMDMPQKAYTTYGAPKEIYLNVSLDNDQWDFEFITLGKQPTMIGESTMVTFQPFPALLPLGNGSAWRLDKLGQPVDPEAVQDGGNQYTHGVWNGASAQTMSGTMKIQSLDAINMNPITNEFPIGNPLPASYLESMARAGKGLSRLAPGSVRGMAVNLHNNLWNTNYALFYPYFDSRFCTSPLVCKNSNALWRFRVSFEPAKQSSVYI